jgi:hypothetical protein
MVTPGSGSRPADFSQAEVDDLVRGDYERVSTLGRMTSPEASEGVAVAGGQSQPVDLSPRELSATKRSGQPSAAVSKRIAAAERAETNSTAQKPRTTTRAASAPSIAPMKARRPSGRPT